MIIHENETSLLDHLYWADLWQYVFESGGNNVLIQFTAPVGYLPKTGDRVLGNKLVKGDGK